MIPQHAIHDVGVGRIELDLDGARVLVDEEDLLPRAPAVGRAEDAALRVGAVGMSKSRDKDDVGVGWMDDQASDLLHVAQADVGPRLPGVNGLEDAVTDAEIRSMEPLAGADVEDVGIRPGHADVADRPGGRRVEDRCPGSSVVVRLPYPAVVHAGEEHGRLGGDADAADGAARAERANEAVVEILIDRWGNPGGRLLSAERGDGEREEEKREHGHKPTRKELRGSVFSDSQCRAETCRADPSPRHPTRSGTKDTKRTKEEDNKKYLVLFFVLFVFFVFLREGPSARSARQRLSLCRGCRRYSPAMSLKVSASTPNARAKPST